MDKIQYDSNLESTDYFTDLMFKAYDLDKNGYIGEFAYISRLAVLEWFDYIFSAL